MLSLTLPTLILTTSIPPLLQLFPRQSDVCNAAFGASDPAPVPCAQLAPGTARACCPRFTTCADGYNASDQWVRCNIRSRDLVLLDASTRSSELAPSAVADIAIGCAAAAAALGVLAAVTCKRRRRRLRGRENGTAPPPSQLSGLPAELAATPIGGKERAGVGVVELAAAAPVRELQGCEVLV
ncbi:uncharacterized protein K452DRAFT_294446 [Aplosporella prunicola CBS 121167]|uniref:Extracellular membrane protein CFEM domain-containing protein n=1 Tax=Aplosporella prunicola CBS 121167 TaxID=1176127 RepID=A0A6A6BUC3_9PEZI|nr:uncharacterized protein K452DRAFT_294446 [Aplosporella prunicola CBS 121167]KAF2146923.1 hypothetical protein K452DRAFT_294446 [Aplosporella prunicola CBS 121167]